MCYNLHNNNTSQVHGECEELFILKVFCDNANWIINCEIFRADSSRRSWKRMRNLVQVMKLPRNWSTDPLRMLISCNNYYKHKHEKLHGNKTASVLNKWANLLARMLKVHFLLLHSFHHHQQQWKICFYLTWHNIIIYLQSTITEMNEKKYKHTKENTVR